MDASFWVFVLIAFAGGALFGDALRELNVGRMIAGLALFVAGILHNFFL